MKYKGITIYGLVKKSVMHLFISWITFLLDLELYLKTENELTVKKKHWL